MSPPLQRQGPELDGASLEPGWAVGWGAGSLEGAVLRVGLWHQSGENQRGIELGGTKGLLLLTEGGARPWEEKAW